MDITWSNRSPLLAEKIMRIMRTTKKLSELDFVQFGISLSRTMYTIVVE
jgi:hypothetical protein